MGEGAKVWFRRIAVAALVLALGVVVLGAYVRLSNAGLGCPDWPVCYGAITWPDAPDEIAAANQAFPHRPVETGKAWREQVHRHFAATLGVLVLSLALIACWHRSRRRWAVLGAAGIAALGTISYIAGKAGNIQLLVDLSAGLAFPAVLLPVYLAWRWRADRLQALTVGLLGLIVFQAMLGMWTVTLLLKPIVVTAHLLGGMATLGLLAWINLRTAARAWRVGRIDFGARRLAQIGLLVLVLQIALGAWTSSNYAAIACPDLPTCQGQMWPEGMDFGEGFVLWRGLGVDYEGGVLDHAARVAIHHSHRVGALVTALFLFALGLSLLRARLGGGGASAAGLLLGALTLQLIIGIAVVGLGFPLVVAAAHNAGAALLLLSLLATLHVLTPVEETLA